ncbi:putative DNA polymerase III subunit epsilon [Sinorhizobium phage phiM9]|uniref:Putative DNA polymerase III subunit epsilon n=1 Tax=Sinorhizobium phage phiM9 TaxID=1636182 RepID=A0A0F6R602_9CAUD|nr:putative DNA polymerase III subunit epsilon [Sinorhizobium phage phiM9]AKE44800.1 putative DNA polymerase III subunit epsilon [Sinorhizobium phage phiM9]
MLNEHGLYEIGRTKELGNGQKIRYLTEMPRHFPEREPEGNVYEATFVDFETTGLDTENDEITQMGWVRFQFDDSMKITKVVSQGVKHNIPEREVSEDAARLTGFTKAKLQEIGEMITQEDFDRAFGNIEFALAHNAKYDRRFIDRFYKAEPLVWGCTNADLDIKSRFMIPSNSLGVLMAYMKDWYFGHHDALDDSFAGVHLADMFFKELVEKIFKPSFKAMAYQSAFESKDALKLRGYKWEPTVKTWWKGGFTEEEVEEELKWLDQYCGGKQEKLAVDLKARHL